MKNYNPDTNDDQSEMLIEVDKHDNVIGPIPREICHNQTRKPWHRTTHIYLFNEKGEIYFSRRSLKKDTAAGLWTVSAGGHVTFGTTPEETAEGEVEEELGVYVDLEFLDKFKIDYGTEREMIAIFIGITDKTFTINEDEVAEIKAFDLEDIIRKFNNGEFELSGGSNDSFRHLIANGKLVDYWKKHFLS